MRAIGIHALKEPWQWINVALAKYLRNSLSVEDSLLYWLELGTTNFSWGKQCKFLTGKRMGQLSILNAIY